MKRCFTQGEQIAHTIYNGVRLDLCRDKLSLHYVSSTYPLILILQHFLHLVILTIIDIKFTWLLNATNTNSNKNKSWNFNLVNVMLQVVLLVLMKMNPLLILEERQELWNFWRQSMDTKGETSGKIANPIYNWVHYILTPEIGEVRSCITAMVAIGLLVIFFCSRGTHPQDGWW